MIDVVLANFNHSETIRLAIDALLAQDLQPSKIIIVDDASTDNSSEVISKIIEDFPSIILVQNQVNLGAIESYRIGFSQVTSDYVYFAAADDTTNPFLFSKCVQLLQTNRQASFACCDAKIIDVKNGKESYRPIIRPLKQYKYMTPLDVAIEFRSNENWILTGACVFKSKTIFELGGMSPKLRSSADSFLARRLAFKYGCCYFPYFGVNWNVSNSSLSRSESNDLTISSNLFDQIMIYIKLHGEFPEWYANKYARVWLFNMLRINLDSPNSNADILIFFFPKLHLIKFLPIKYFKHLLLISTFIWLRPYPIKRLVLNYIQRSLHGF